MKKVSAEGVVVWQPDAVGLVGVFLPSENIPISPIYRFSSRSLRNQNSFLSYSKLSMHLDEVVSTDQSSWEVSSNPF